MPYGGKARTQTPGSIVIKTPEILNLARLLPIRVHFGGWIFHN